MSSSRVVIIGGGPAGLSTAVHLRALAPALEVIVLERETYPRDKICAGAIGGRALPLLRTMGVSLDAQHDAVPSVRIDRFVVDVAGERIDVTQPDGARVVRRHELDHALALQALASGVDVRTGSAVRGLTRTARGFSVALSGATSIEADVVVGADGVTGLTRRALGLARPSLRAQAAEVDTERSARDPDEHTIGFVFLPALRGYAWDFPTPIDGRVMMSRGVYVLRDQRGGPTPQAVLTEHLAKHGLSLAEHRVRQLAEHGYDPSAVISTPRALLVGEAAGIDHPTGEGIAQALLSGEVAAGYLAARLATDRLDFADWRATLLGSAEGRFLHRRWWGGRLLFGEHRGLVQRTLARSPRVFELALARFAGRPLPVTGLPLALAQVGSALVQSLWAGHPG